MQVSRIEQKIEDIYAFVESCKMQHLSTTKVVVPKNDLYDLLDDLRRDVPEEIKRYQKILSQRDAILEDAERKASAILIDAQEQYKALVEEHNIMQQAYQQADFTVQQANEAAEAIVANARNQAEEIGSGAIYYTTDLLDMMEKLLASTYENSVKNSQNLEKTLTSYLETVRQNKRELQGSMESSQSTEPELQIIPELQGNDEDENYEDGLSYPEDDYEDEDY